MSQTKERPILFSGPMVRAILGGRKTQTRRIIKGLANDGAVFGVRPMIEEPGMWLYNNRVFPCPYGKPGDQLWVRETFCELRRWHFNYTTQPRDAMLAFVNRKNGCAYAAEITPGSDTDDIRKAYGYKWKPSIHMPRWASRITLEIVSVRVERLNDISRADAKAEGVKNVGYCTSAIEKVGGPEFVAVGCWANYITPTNPFLDPMESFASLWQSINGPESWAANPWVWVVEFRMVTP